jgi:hypothetical protein
MTAQCFIKGELLETQTAMEMAKHLHGVVGDKPSLGQTGQFSFSEWNGEYEIVKCQAFSRYPHQINATIRRK